MLLRQAIDMYISAQTDKRPQTVASRAKILRHMCRHLGDFPITVVTLNDLAAWVKSGDVAPGTRKNRIKVATAFFDWAEWQELIVFNPGRHLSKEVPVKNVTVKEHTWLTVEESRALLEQVQADDTIRGRRDELIVRLGLQAGLRVAEISNLRWADLNFDHNWITVRAEVAKSNQHAVVGMMPSLAAFLQEWEPTGPYVVPSIMGTADSYFYSSEQPLSARVIQKRVQALGAFIGKRLAPHDLRRSSTELLLTAGKSIDDVSKFLRHSHPGVTAVYLSKSPHKQAFAVSGVDI